jgi:chitinase
MAKTEEGRKAFAEDCRAFLINWGLDGIDIDWELPGISWSGHACDPAVDTDNYTLLMKQLRETLGSRYLLTFAGYIKDKVEVEGGWKFVDLKGVEPYVDFMNIMTYDMDSAPSHQSALKDNSAYWDCERAVNAYLGAGVPASKLVLGIPFYGRHSFDVSPTAIDYKDILKLDQSKYKIDNWDAAASVPFVTVRSNNSYYCGYDNPQSIAIKAKWALNLGLKGVMFWDYDADDSNGTLRKAVWENIMKP